MSVKKKLTLLDYLSEMYPDCQIAVADGFDDCVIGVCYRSPELFLVYNSSKVIAKLMKVHKMSRDNAVDYFEFNIAGAWVGEGTPAFVEPVPYKPGPHKHERRNK